MFSPGTMIDHFRVMRLLGKGGMGEVYLARDSQLGRQVALKLILPRFLGSQSTVERFQFEARATATFSHPHIITIYAVGNHEGSPYVALEYLEGQTLRQRMVAEQFSVPEALRVALSIASALQEAHQHKILHRDLKPENIFLPRDGRLRVLDFGLAKKLDSVDLALAETMASASIHTGATHSTVIKHPESKAGEIRGTPQYMAPEQWEGRTCSRATDIWALGVILYELVAGLRPFSGKNHEALAEAICGHEVMPPGAVSAAVPDSVSDLICRCLIKDDKRRPSVDSLIDEMEKLLSNKRSRAVEVQNPFRGLLPFSERHTEVFFGRDAETAAFLERLREEPVLPVVGPSGAGKSSFVQAGVIPRLREQGPWQVLTLRPGTSPFTALAAALLSSGGSSAVPNSTSLLKVISGKPRALGDHHNSEAARLAGERDAIAEQFFATPGRLSLALQHLAEVGGCKVLLFVDQFEELYTQVEDEDTRIRFAEAICSAADDPRAPTRVIFTLRDDFLGRMSEGKVARRTLSRVTVLRSPDPEDLRDILVQPVKAAGYSYDDPGLVDEIVQSVQGEAASLPLVQLAMQVMWEQRDRGARLIRRSTYDEMGGFSGVLAQHADTVLKGFSSEDTRLAREIFLRLVTAEGTKQIVPRARLLEGLSSNAREILGRLVENKTILVRKASHGEHGEGELELVHDSLITCWGQLARWLNESREEMVFFADAGQAAELWEKRGRREQEVWHGGALGEAKRILQQCTSKAPEHVLRFLEAGKQREERVLRGRRRRRIMGVGALALVALISAVLAVVFARQKREIGRQKTLAVTREAQARSRMAEAHREGALAAHAQGHLLEARAKLRTSLEIEDNALPRALWWKLSRSPLRRERKLDTVIHDMALSADGQTLAAACLDKHVYLLGAATRDLRVLPGHRFQVSAVTLSADGSRLASGDKGGGIKLWDLARNRHQDLKGHDSEVLDLQFSRDGKAIISGSMDRTARVWKVSTGSLIKTLRHPAPVLSVAADPGGEVVATGDPNGEIRRWDLTAQPPLKAKVFKSKHGSQIYALAFSRDGKRLATGDVKGTVRIWDPASQAVLHQWQAHASWITGLLFGASNELLISGSMDTTIRFWRPPYGARPRWQFTRHKSPIKGLGISDDGSTLGSASKDGTIRLWRTRPAREHSGKEASHVSSVNAVALGPDGKHIASGGKDRKVRLWDVRSGEVTRILAGHVAEVRSLDFSPGGELLASADESGKVMLWDVGGSGGKGRVVTYPGQIHIALFDPLSGHLAVAGAAGVVDIWAPGPPTGSGDAVRIGTVNAGMPVLELAFNSRQPQLVARGYFGTVKSWKLKGGSPTGPGQTLYEAPAGQKRLTRGLAFSPDGEQLAVSTPHDEILFLNPATGNRTGHLPALPHRVLQLKYSGDGKWLGAATRSRVGYLLSLSGEDRVLLTGHRAEVNSLAFSSNAGLVATGSDDGTVRLWNATSGHPRWRGVALLPDQGLLYTQKGWTRLPAAEGRGAPVKGPTAPWGEAVARRGRYASVLNTGGAPMLCVLTLGDEVERWNLSSGKREYQEPLPGLEQVLAVPGGCLTLAQGRAGVVYPTGKYQELAEQATALGRGDDMMLVASGQHALAFDRQGKRAGTWRLHHPGVSALYLHEGTLALGYARGSIELLPVKQGRDAGRPALLFEGIPASAVTKLARGPGGTILAGYANGTVGLWSVTNGAMLHQTRLHGAITHLAMSGDRLQVATNLGDHLALDLGVFKEPWCKLLRAVWREVPVVWDNGLPVRRTPLADHACSGQAKSTKRGRGG